ncbi:hypothetical protein BGZ65_009084, partial [Modicella reniformis]
MVFWSTSSSRGTLSIQQSLELVKVCLENARKTKDFEVASELCRNAEAALSQLRPKDQSLNRDIGAAYSELGKFQDSRGQSEKAQTSRKKAEQWGIAHSIKSTSISAVNIPVSKSLSHPPSLNEQSCELPVPPHIFAENVRPPTIVFHPPELAERLSDTPQLACCLGLLRVSRSLDDMLEPTARNWLQAIEKDVDEQERLKILSTDVIRAFKRDELKDAKAVSEVIYLAPVLGKDEFRYLLKEFYSGIEQSDLLDIHQLEGLAQLIQGADPGYLDSDDLVKILKLLSTRLRNTHRQSLHHMYQLTLAVSNVLDAMADSNVKGLDREE